MKRTRADQTISLFSFQDIITAVTGIFLLITIILALSLVRSRRSTSSGQTDNASQLFHRIGQLRTLTAEHHARLERLTTQSLTLADMTPSQARQRLAPAQHEVKTLQSEVESLRKRRDIMLGQLDVAREKEQKTASITAEDLTQVDQKIDAATEQLRRIHSESRVYYNPINMAGMRPWLLQVSSKVIEVSSAEGTTTVTPFANTNSFFRWAEQRDVSSEYFVLFIRPSGIPTYRQLFLGLTRRDLEFGVDLIGEETSILVSSEH